MGRPARLAPRNATGRSSNVTTGSSIAYGRASTFSTSSMFAMYSASSVGTHHIFFPPRLQLVVGEHPADGLAPHVCDNPSPLALLGRYADRPPRIYDRMFKQCFSSGFNVCWVTLTCVC